MDHSAPLLKGTPSRSLRRGEGEAVDGFALEILVGVQVLAGGLYVGMSHELLDGHDIGAGLQETDCVCVSKKSVSGYYLPNFGSGGYRLSTPRI